MPLLYPRFCSFCRLLLTFLSSWPAESFHNLGDLIIEIYQNNAKISKLACQLLIFYRSLCPLVSKALHLCCCTSCRTPAIVVISPKGLLGICPVYPIVRKTLRMVWCSRVARRKPYLTKKNIQAKLHFVLLLQHSFKIPHHHHEALSPTPNE